MHEAVLYRDLRRKIDELAEAHRPARIVGVTVWLGALSHLTAPALRAAWAGLLAGSRAEGAALTVERSEDPGDARAGAVVLRSVRLSDSAPSPPGGSPKPRIPGGA